MIASFGSERSDHCRSLIRTVAKKEKLLCLFLKKKQEVENHKCKRLSTVMCVGGIGTGTGTGTMG